MQLDKTIPFTTYYSVTMPFIQDSHLPLSSFAKTHLDNPDNFDPSLSLHTIMNGHLISQEAYRQASTGTLSVSQALDIARDSEEEIRDPVVIGLLEVAINNIWRKLQEEPTTYVMTREEFGVFNYFQNRFQGVELATAARRRYWDSQHS
ncbi:hypothetical protein BOTCAL_0774g00010 [Botryotinia calthae]|uniref:Uncharacterized protein n=1 Tax=Botryotinia calthae TaxID=38488 RepID=A0A4Y8CIW3_9HELO|nr:hypothetical protein BOTCAL_0774g00010 [Botryotinia calthae]